MGRALIGLIVAAALLPSGAHASTVIGSCSASTPRVSLGGIDDASACVASFTTTVRQQVTTRIVPGSLFAGWALLRVRGVNALWTQYDGYFVGPNRVIGQDTSTFWLEPGTWQIEVYVGDPNAGLTGAGHFGIGSYGGTVSTA